MKIVENLSFSPASPELTLDLCLPEKAEKGTGELTPVILLIPGGGFSSQDGKGFRPSAEALAEAGLAGASVGYRGRPEHTYRDTVAGLKAAVRYLRSLSEEYHLDASRVGAMGRSAGGTLATLLGVTGGMAEFEGHGGHEEYSSEVQAVVSFCGPQDFVARFSHEEHRAVPEIEEAVARISEWIGTPFDVTSEDWLKASPITHIAPSDPPILLLHCRDDPVVPWLQSRDMHEALTRMGVDSTLTIYETGGHGFETPEAEQGVGEMIEFFRAKLG